MRSIVCTDLTFTCRRCEVERDTSEFYKDNARPNGIDPYCKDCRRVERKKYYHLEATPEFIRNSGLKRRYGITLQEYEEMYERQGGVCAICGEDASRSSHGVLQVDHCHETKKVRALLCSRCNTCVGVEETNPGLLVKVGSYVERFHV